MQNISDCRKIFFHDLVALDYFRVNFHRIAGNLRALTARHSGIIEFQSKETKGSKSIWRFEVTDSASAGERKLKFFETPPGEKEPVKTYTFTITVVKQQKIQSSARGTVNPHLLFPFAK